MKYHYDYGTRLSKKGKEICYTEEEAMDLIEQLQDRGAEVSWSYETTTDDNGVRYEFWFVAWDY